MQYERIEIGLLVRDPRNARKHNKRNIEVIKKSLQEFGQQKPIVVDENNKVLAGNGTLQAAMELGWSEIDVARSSLDEIRAKAYALADNRSAELAEWDNDILAETLKELDEVEFDIDMLGFDDISSEIEQWQVKAQNVDEIDSYDEQKDTYLIKIENVKQCHKNEVVNCINDVISKYGYESKAY